MIYVKLTEQQENQIREILCDEFDWVEQEVFDEMGVIEQDIESESDRYQEARECVFEIQEERWNELEQELFGATA